MAEPCRHEECWLLLPWLANGRLSHSDRLRVEEHVRSCAQCTHEVAVQRLMCRALTEPDRVSYAPGPSFRKLLERIDDHRSSPREERQPGRARTFPWPARTAWRPPGLAWAASVVLATGLVTVAATAYRWSQPLYATYTAVAPATPDVLHIAFVPSLSIAAAGEVLHGAGARVVEGPDATGIFGVTPVAAPPHADGRTAQTGVNPQMRALAARLRADPRVRWVQPLADDTPTGTPERHAPER
jgi:hypothetical protein